MTAAIPTRGARRKAATRQRLLEAAADVYARVGVEGATIAAITEQADVGLGTFYLHFDDKETIAAAVGSDLLARIGAAANEAVRALGGDDPLTAHRAATRAVCRVSADEARLLHALYRWGGTGRGSALRDAFVDRMAVGLEGAMAAGALRAEEPVLAAHALLGLYAEAILWWASEGRDDWDALAAFLERSSIGALS